MPHKIIVEGFDGGGKSTIVKALSEALHQEAFYNKGPPGTVLNAIEFVQRHFEMVHNHVIMDRVTCISEYCYGFDRLSDMDERWLLVTAQLTTKDVSIVWCRSIVYNDILDNTGDTEQYGEWLYQNAPQIMDRYTKIMRMLKDTGRRIIIYDFRTNSIGEVIRQLI